MAGGEDWIMRPCREGMYTLGEIKAGLIDMLDVAIANDALDVKLANERLWRERNPDR